MDGNDGGFRIVSVDSTKRGARPVARNYLDISSAASKACSSLWRTVTDSGPHIMAPVRVGQQNVLHEFVVVNNLVTPAILGVDFLQRYKLVLDFVNKSCQHRTQYEKAPIQTGREWVQASSISSSSGVRTLG